MASVHAPSKCEWETQLLKTRMLVKRGEWEEMILLHCYRGIAAVFMDLNRKHCNHKSLFPVKGLSFSHWESILFVLDKDFTLQDLTSYGSSWGKIISLASVSVPPQKTTFAHHLNGTEFTLFKIKLVYQKSAQKDHEWSRAGAALTLKLFHLTWFNFPLKQACS